MFGMCNSANHRYETLLFILTLCCDNAVGFRTLTVFRKLAVTEANCVASRLLYLQQKAALERTAKTTADGQQACTFCACLPLRENTNAAF